VEPFPAQVWVQARSGVLPCPCRSEPQTIIYIFQGTNFIKI
jgi:hypothetical protein